MFFSSYIKIKYYNSGERHSKSVLLHLTSPPSWILTLRHRDIVLLNYVTMHPLSHVINHILYTKTYMRDIRLLTRLHSAYHVFSALYLLRIYAIDSNDRWVSSEYRASRKYRASRRYQTKARLISPPLLHRRDLDDLYLPQRRLDLNLDSHSVLNFRIHLSSRETEISSRTKIWRSSTNWLWIGIISPPKYSKLNTFFRDLEKRLLNIRYPDVDLLNNIYLLNPINRLTIFLIIYIIYLRSIHER